MRIRLSTLLLLILALLPVLFFFKSADDFKAAPPAPAGGVAQVTPEIEASHLKSDLLWLRNSTIKRRHLLYTVNYTGPESRIFKHWQSKLIPTVCAEITSVEIQSRQPSYALTLTATCLDRQQGKVAMDIAWVKHGAAISFPAYKAREGVELF